MNDLATLPKPQAQKMRRETFDIFKIGSSSLNNGKAYPIDSADTYEDAVRIGALRNMHKEKFMVKRTDTFNGDVTLHFFAVRRKSQGVKRYHNYQTRTVHDEYADHLFDLKPEGVV